MLASVDERRSHLWSIVGASLVDATAQSLGFALRILGCTSRCPEKDALPRINLVEASNSIRYGGIPDVARVGFGLGMVDVTIGDSDVVAQFIGALERLRGRSSHALDELASDEVALLGMADGLAACRVLNDPRVKSLSSWLVSLVEKRRAGTWSDRLRDLAADLLDSRGRLRMRPDESSHESLCVEFCLRAVWPVAFDMSADEVFTTARRAVLETLLISSPPPVGDLEKTAIGLVAIDTIVTSLINSEISGLAVKSAGVAHRDVGCGDGVRNVLSVATEWESRHGGLSTFNRHLCRALARSSYRVVCAVPHATDGERKDAEASGVVIATPPRTVGIEGIESLLAGLDLPAGFNPDVIIGHDRKTGPVASALLGRFPRAIRIHVIHTRPEDIEWHKDYFGPDDAAVKGSERRVMQQELAAGATLVIGVGPALFNAARSLVYLAEPRPHVVRLDPGFESISRPIDLPPELFVLVLGRAEDFELKGLDVAARAIAGVTRREKVLPPRLIVRGAPRGTGSELRAKLVAAAGCSIAVEVREYVPDVHTIRQDILQSSLVLMPSKSEGFGLVGLEAIAAATPVLVSDQSGLGMLLREKLGQDAERFVVETHEDADRSALEWERSVERVLLHRDASFSDAMMLRARLAESLSWDRACQALDAALSQAVSCSGK